MISSIFDDLSFVMISEVWIRTNIPIHISGKRRKNQIQAPAIKPVVVKNIWIPPWATMTPTVLEFLNDRSSSLFMIFLILCTFIGLPLFTCT